MSARRDPPCITRMKTGNMPINFIIRTPVYCPCLTIVGIEFLAIIFFFPGSVPQIFQTRLSHLTGRFIAVAAVIGPANCDARATYYNGYPYDGVYYYGPNVGCQCTKA